MKRVLLPLAEGFEEIEAVTIADVLRRAGVEVVIAGLLPGPCRGSRGVVLLPDAVLDDVAAERCDALVLPGGGPGTAALRADARVGALVRAFAAAGKITAAICAAPTVLLDAGLLRGKRATAHPSVWSELRAAEVDVRDERVVEDGRVITSQAPGTTIEFALRLAEVLCGAGTGARLNEGLRARL